MTAVILIAIGLYVLSSGGFPLFLFLSLVSWLSFYEIKKITNLTSTVGFVLNALIFQLGFTFIFLKGLTHNLIYVYFSLIGCLFIIMFNEFFNKRLLFRSNKVFNYVKYFLYIYAGFSSIFLIRERENGFLFILLLFLAIWTTDVFAYYGGKRFGKHQLSNISPKKTKEGTIIGVVMAMVVIGFYSYFNQLPLTYIILAGFIGSFAQLGDLYESLIKRTYNVKDSSNILPGHGGILDRADSSLFVAPLMYIFLVVMQ